MTKFLITSMEKPIKLINKKMVLKYFCFFSGVGPVPKALSFLGINSTCVGISESDVDSLLAYYYIHGGVNVTAPTSCEEMYEQLSQFTFKSKGENVNLKDFSYEKLSELYIAHFSTKNMGAIEDIQSLPTTCDIVVYCCKDITKLPQVKRILHATPEKPKILLLETLVKHAKSLSAWKKDLKDLGYHSVSKTLKATQCGVPISRARHFITSNLKKFSMDFSNIEKDHHPMQAATNFLREEGVDCYKRIDIEEPIPQPDDVTPSSNKMKSTEIDGYKVYYIDGVLPIGSDVKIVDVDMSIRYLTPVEHWLLAGFTEDDYMNVKINMSHLAPPSFIKLAAVSSPVYLFTEIFKQLFVTPMSTISTTLTIPPEMLGENLKNNMLSLLKEKYEKKCTNKLYGYVLEVVAVEDIFDAYISDADCSNKVFITYTIRSVKPRLNNVYFGKIKACYTTGILSDIKIFSDREFECNVLVLSDVFDRKNKVNQFSSCQCVFGRGDDILFQITELDYNINNNTFVCVGAHKCTGTGVN